LALKPSKIEQFRLSKAPVYEKRIKITQKPLHHGEDPRQTPLRRAGSRSRESTGPAV
jgi:hypothetical protein